MVQFLSIIFFSWISSIFVGFFKRSRLFVSPCIFHFALIYFYFKRHLFNIKVAIDLAKMKNLRNYLIRNKIKVIKHFLICTL